MVGVIYYRLAAVSAESWGRADLGLFWCFYCSSELRREGGMDGGDGCPPAACAWEAGGCPGLRMLPRDARSLHMVLHFPPRAVWCGTGGLRSVHVFWPHCRRCCPSSLPRSPRTDGQVMLN